MRFNPNLAALAFATTASIASFGAQASSIDVQVIGNITPGACTPTLAGGGVVNYGNIGASQVNRDKVTALPEKTVAMTISCDVPVRLGVRAVDNQAASVVPGVLATVGAGFSDTYNYGLGTVGSAKIGGYVMTLKPGTFVADGANVSAIASVNSGTSWYAATGTLSGVAGRLISWSTTTGGTPVAFQTLTGSFAVQAGLTKGSDLPLSGDVPLSGNATLELVYL